MSIAALDTRPTRDLLPAFRAVARNSRPLAATTILLVLLLLPLGLAWLIDDRLLKAVSVWDKPMKFATSIAMFTGTLCILIGLIDEKARHGTVVRAAAIVAVLMIVYEQGYITLQAARGMPSHFNHTAPLYSWLFALMGIFATILTATAPVIGWQLHRHPTPGLAPALKSATVLGLILTFPLTMITAGTLGAQGGHLVGTTMEGPGLFLMGWSTIGGDLRAPHFFATHVMQVLPIVGLASVAIFGRDRRWPVYAFTVLYCAFVAAVFAQALSGRPFLSL